MTKPPLPHEGVIVADFSRVLAGPFASMILGDLGADVVKVERPDGGDDTRSWGPPWAANAISTYFVGLNRNKRSLALDLTSPADREIALSLIDRSDVLIESFRPGLFAGWGLDGETARKRNPGLISCSISAFGQGEASRELPGYDLLLQAMGGLMSITGEQDGRPLKVGSAVVDLVCGLLAVVGIQAALLERKESGKGRHVDVSLFDSVLTSLLNQASGWIAAGVEPQRRGNRHPSISPYETFEASDRPFALAVGNDKLFRKLCEAIGEPDIGADLRFQSNQARVENRDDLFIGLSTRFATMPAQYWIDRLRAVKVPVGPINSVSEAFALAQELDLASIVGVDGIDVAAPPLRFDGERPAVRLRPPEIGEHSDEIRRWLGQLQPPSGSE